MSDPLIIPNNQGEIPDGLDLSRGRFISIFESKSGKQSIFSADRKTNKAQLCIVDSEGGWAVEAIKYEDLDGPFVLNSNEQAWLIACWASLLHKPVFEVASKYLSARQTRTMLVSLGVPAEVHEQLLVAFA
jgi:hypothetical protein